MNCSTCISSSTLQTKILDEKQKNAERERNRGETTRSAPASPNPRRLRWRPWPRCHSPPSPATPLAAAGDHLRAKLVLWWWRRGLPPACVRAPAARGPTGSGASWCSCWRRLHKPCSSWRRPIAAALVPSLSDPRRRRPGGSPARASRWLTCARVPAGSDLAMLVLPPSGCCVLRPARRGGMGSVCSSPGRLLPRQRALPPMLLLMVGHGF